MVNPSTDTPQFEIGLKWQTFRELAFSYERPEAELAYDALQFVVEANWTVSPDAIGVQCTVRLKRDAASEPFLTLTTEAIVAMQGLSEVASFLSTINTQPNQFPVPIPLMVSIAGIAISTTRGVLWEKSKTLDLPGLDRILMPTINTEALLPNPETMVPLQANP